MISKYVQYGVLPKERGEHIKNHLDKHFEMMKQNGFVPKHHPHPHKFEKDIKMVSIQWELGAFLLLKVTE